MLPQCSHITRKRGVYYYRRRLPGTPKRELALSLHTRHFREAQWVAAILDREYSRVIGLYQFIYTGDGRARHRDGYRAYVEEQDDDACRQQHIRRASLEIRIAVSRPDRRERRRWLSPSFGGASSRR
jgi:hypothetical protein